MIQNFRESKLASPLEGLPDAAGYRRVATAVITGNIKNVTVTVRVSGIPQLASRPLMKIQPYDSRGNQATTSTGGGIPEVHINVQSNPKAAQTAGAQRGSNLVRFSVSMPEDLVIAFDRMVARRGITHNRSELIRDLVRNALIDEEWNSQGNPDQELIGTLTMIYNHRASNLTETLDAIQHAHYQQIISSMHVHLDACNCLEVIAMRGSAEEIHMIANALLGTKGVMHGHLTTTSTGSFC